MHKQILNRSLIRLLTPVEGQADHFRIEENITDLFEQACEYLYTGDYSVGVSGSVGGSEEDGTDHDYCASEFYPEGPTLRLKENFFMNEASVLERSKSLTNDLPFVPGYPFCGQRPFVCKHPDTLFLHQQLYVFADTHGLEELKCIALDKLLNTLAVLPMCTSRIPHIVQLFRVASESGVQSEIFIMMLHYVSSRLQFLICRPSLVELLHERPELNCELLAYLAKSSQSYSRLECCDQ